MLSCKRILHHSNAARNDGIHSDKRICTGYWDFPKMIPNTHSGAISQKLIYATFYMINVFLAPLTIKSLSYKVQLVNHSLLSINYQSKPWEFLLSQSEKT